MAKKNQQKVAPQAKDRSTGEKISHWAKVTIMFLSGGFVFPHAMTEYEDTDSQPEHHKKN